MAKKKYQKITPEEEARHAETQRLARERIAEREAIDRAEAARKSA